MNTGARLGLYALGLVVAFGGAFSVAGAVVPDGLVADWEKGSEMNGHGEAHGAGAVQTGPTTTAALKGLALGADGYLLSPIDAPSTVGEADTLSFQIQDAAGAPITQYTNTHDRDLHLIVVRSDGSQFRHVHPELGGETGTWSLPWEWEQAGSYRVFADFTPAGAEASGLTLTRTVHVAGEFSPVASQPSHTDEVGGYEVTLAGDMVAGSSSKLEITISRDGKPVTTLEPYLGAFGHLVALREGDLAFLHVHAEGEEPHAGNTAGPVIAFAAEAPTAGRYLLYLDFQVDGEVHTAEFVLDAASADGSTAHDGAQHSEGH